jgi:hypothetical protein
MTKLDDKLSFKLLDWPESARYVLLEMKLVQGDRYSSQLIEPDVRMSFFATKSQAWTHITRTIKTTGAAAKTFAANGELLTREIKFVLFAQTDMSTVSEFVARK